MRTSRTEMVEKIVTTYRCDFCSFSTEHNSGCCGYSAIMSCSICEKDMCHKHRHVYEEEPWSDSYPDFVVCPDCNPDLSVAWNWALCNARRHDSIVEVTKEAFERIKNGEDLS